jgi:predicted RNA-binding protein with EMAP domain
MTAKKMKVDERGVLESNIQQLMTSKAIDELKELSPTLQQFLLRWQDQRDLILSEQLKIELKDFLQELHESENKEMCKEVADIVGKQLAEVLEPWNRKLGNIERVLENVDKWQKGVDKWQQGVEELIAKMDTRLHDVEEEVYKTHELRVKKLERYTSFWNTTARIASGIIIGTSITIFLVYYLFLK